MVYQQQQAATNTAADEQESGDVVEPPAMTSHEAPPCESAGPVLGNEKCMSDDFYEWDA